MSAGEFAGLRRGLSRLLTERCTIERRVVGADDPYGQPTTTGWSAIATAVPCALGPEGFQALGERNRPARDEIGRGWTLVLPFGTDVNERDRVVNVTLPDGSLLESGPLDLTLVRRLSSHVEAAAERVS